MAAPAGPCEWCQGPQQWTIIQGEMYVRCIGGCLPLALDMLVPPPDSEDLEGSVNAVGTFGKVEGVTRSGREAEETDDDLPF